MSAVILAGFAAAHLPIFPALAEWQQSTRGRAAYPADSDPLQQAGAALDLAAAVALTLDALRRIAAEPG